MNDMGWILEGRKLKRAVQAIHDAIEDSNGDEAAAVDFALAVVRKDDDLIEGLVRYAVKQLAASRSGDRDGVGVGHGKSADQATVFMPASTPTNSGAMGHGNVASNRGHIHHAPAPLPERGEEGPLISAPHGAGWTLPSSPLPLSKNTGGAGHIARAQERLKTPARPPVPYSTRHLSVVEKTRNAIATGILAKHRLHDGKIYTELYGRELPYYQTKAEPMAIQHLIIKTIRRDYPTIDPNKRLGEEGSNTLSRTSLENIIKHAEEVIRAVA